MQTTTNIGLKTYEANDPTDWLGEFNYNMNKIDEAVGSQNDAIDVIEETAGTAVTTANTANDTATEALTTAETKTSVNDNVASATTTYSSNKINELIEGAGGAVIDDSTTSLTSTWSSSKINTDKASINDTTASATTTYSSNKIDDLLDNINPTPYTGDSANTVTNHPATQTTINENLKKFSTGSIPITTAGYYYLSVDAPSESSTDRTYCFSILSCNKGNNNIFNIEKEHTKKNNFTTSSSGHISFNITSNIYYLPANCTINFSIYSNYISSPYPDQVQLHKIN